MPNDTLIAVDLAKSVFEIAVSKRPGKVAERRRLSREKFLAFFVNRPKATVLMEACGSAHYWGREIERLGHKAVLLPPKLKQAGALPSFSPLQPEHCPWRVAVLEKRALEEAVIVVAAGGDQVLVSVAVTVHDSERDLGPEDRHERKVERDR